MWKLAIYCVNFGVNFIFQKFCPCKKMTNYRYELHQVLCPRCLHWAHSRLGTHHKPHSGIKDQYTSSLLTKNHCLSLSFSLSFLMFIVIGNIITSIISFDKFGIFIKILECHQKWKKKRPSIQTKSSNSQYILHHQLYSHSRESLWHPKRNTIGKRSKNKLFHFNARLALDLSAH